MKGNIDDDDKISSKDAAKKTFGSNYLALLSSFACLLIGVNQEGEGTTLHKEKKT